MIRQPELTAEDIDLIKYVFNNHISALKLCEYTEQERELKKLLAKITGYKKE